MTTEREMLLNAASDLQGALVQEGRVFSAAVVDALITMARLEDDEATERPLAQAPKKRGRKSAAADAPAAAPDPGVASTEAAPIASIGTGGGATLPAAPVVPPMPAELKPAAFPPATVVG